MQPIEDIFKAIAPQYLAEDPARVAVFAVMAAERIAKDVFGGLYNQAVAYLTAHLMTLADRMSQGGGDLGPVKSASTGGVSVSYGWSTTWGAWDADLSSTPYGVSFIALRRQLGGIGMRLIRG